MGGSSGGGGSSGAVDYPEYLKAYHKTYLGRRIFELGAMADAAAENNPYITAQSFNPSTALLAIAQEALWLKQAVQLLGNDDASKWSSIFQTVAENVDTTVDELDLMGFDPTAAVQAYDAQLTSILESTTLPKFRGEMRSIGAVQSSAFAVGEALMIANKDREVAKFAAEANLRMLDIKLRVKAEMVKSGVDSVVSMMAKRIEHTQNAVHYGIEARRLEIAAMKEYMEKESEYDAQASLWELEVSEYVNHGIASIAGAATTSTGKKANSMTSAIGGALVGAGVGGYMAAGTAVGGPMGAVIGGAVGLGAGLLMG